MWAEMMQREEGSLKRKNREGMADAGWRDRGALGASGDPRRGIRLAALLAG
jgi:hypothetical protein